MVPRKQVRSRQVRIRYEFDFLLKGSFPIYASPSSPPRHARLVTPPSIISRSWISIPFLAQGAKKRKGKNTEKGQGYVQTLCIKITEDSCRYIAAIVTGAAPSQDIALLTLSVSHTDTRSPKVPLKSASATRKLFHSYIL